jgi:hypothetical protein
MNGLLTAALLMALPVPVPVLAQGAAPDITPEAEVSEPAPDAADDALDARLSRMFMGQSQMQGEALSAAIDRAGAHPLGSPENPVRVSMPAGQRAYLSRLRCADAQAPGFVRAGSVGVGPFGNIVDLYQVTCEGSQPAEAEVYMDMYHSGHVEDRPVTGFTIDGG